MFKCNQCTFQGDYKQNLKRHERNMHGSNKNLAKQGYKTPVLVEENIVRKWNLC